MASLSFLWPVHLPFWSSNPHYHKHFGHLPTSVSEVNWSSHHLRHMPGPCFSSLHQHLLMITDRKDLHPLWGTPHKCRVWPVTSKRWSHKSPISAYLWRTWFFRRQHASVRDVTAPFHPHASVWGECYQRSAPGLLTQSLSSLGAMTVWPSICLCHLLFQKWQFRNKYPQKEPQSQPTSVTR